MTTPREDRIRNAAGELAWAYILLQGEGDSVRAAGALLAFQRFWNNNQPLLRTNAATGAVLSADTGFPASLVVDGAWGRQTASAAALALYAGRLFSEADVNRLQFDPRTLTAWLQSVQSRMPNAANWAAYDVAHAAPPADVMRELENWAYLYIDPVSSSSTTTADLNRLARDAGGNLPPPGSAANPVRNPQSCGADMVWDPALSACVPPDQPIFGITSLTKRANVWPWVIGGTAAAIIGVGLAVKFGRRRR